MGRRSFPEALDEALRPFGFKRDGDDWVRVRGDMWECVNRQSRWLGGVTANLFQQDLQTEKLYIEVFGPEEPRPFVAASRTIGSLMDGYSRWWKKDQVDGPAEMAQAVIEYGLPWFDRVRTPEAQAINWYDRDKILSDDRFHGQTGVLLAITLYRLGHYDDALRVVRRPPPRHPIHGTVERTTRLREWLEANPLT